MRKIFIVGGLLLLLVSAVLSWRRLHPPLSDEQQIAAALDGIAAAANSRSPRGIANYLSKDFKFGGTGKSEFQNSLVGAMLQYRVVDLKVSGVKVEVQSTTASSDGRYILNLKTEFNAPPEVFAGKFALKWRKVQGQWLVTSAQGDEIPH